MITSYLKNATCLKELKAAENESLDSIILISSYLLSKRNEDVLAELLSHSVRVLKKTGILMIQGTPDKLPEVVQPLMRSMFFKYWVAIESETVESKSGLPTRHAALVIFSKSRNSFEINKVRFPHQYCSFCNQTLKDWGGKSHLRNPIGYVISDVWKDLPKINNYTRLSLPALQVALHLIIDADNKGKRCFILPYEGISFTAEDSLQPVLSGFKPNFHNFTKINSTDERHLDIVHNGDAVEILKKYPDNSIDLVFADPPYNLDKFYNTYNDGKEELKYIEWCNSWLSEYVRVLKPTGSLYLLNLPKWAVHHASFLNKHLYFQNWIVWDAVSEPRGKIMPAHYSLLFYTKHPTKFTFNYNALSPLNTPSFCLRSSCIKKRKAQGIDPKLPLTDIWGDIHRIKHKKDRDRHPCQLPEKLLERIILLSTNKGDIVLDALSGVGTTAIAAYKAGRRFVAIELDSRYVEITRRKILQLKKAGFIHREPTKKAISNVSKKELQLEIVRIAQSIGRLPSEGDIQKLSSYNIEVFKEAFPAWGKALKAAKAEFMH